MTKENINNVERNMITSAISNIQSWKDGAYLAGGATSDVDSIKAIEDIKMTKDLNDVTKLVDNGTLTKVLNDMVEANKSQSMFVDSDLLSQIMTKLNQILKK